jgi:flagellar assembly protein FliH
MATIIDKHNIVTHNVDKYKFKVLSLNSKKTSDAKSDKDEFSEPKYTKENHPHARQSDIDSSAMSQSSKDSLIESLLKKTDEMSSNFIKLQMKLEAKEQEYKESLEKKKKISYDEGFEAGKTQGIEEIKNDYENTMVQFSKSIQTLQESAKEFEIALENVKSDLITAALDIAKEVVNVELAQNSSEIAKVLGDELIKELQSASKIKLKVNPKDHGKISQSVGSLENIEIVSDSAVSEGGVIAISDAGNIDAQISKRFERVKRAALSE